MILVVKNLRDSLHMSIVGGQNENGSLKKCAFFEKKIYQQKTKDYEFGLKTTFLGTLLFHEKNNSRSFGSNM